MVAIVVPDMVEVRPNNLILKGNHDRMKCAAIASFAAKGRAHDAQRPNIAQHGDGAPRYAHTVARLLSRSMASVRYLVRQR